MLSADEIRKKYLDFFKERGHAVIPSASLIPENDSTLLFTNSGMFPLVPYLAGEKHPAGKRLVDSQKCFRAEDIEEIGDSRHDTFFEMLGNWSLGDYFKKEQLNWWYEFLIEELKLDPNRLYQTVYAGDPKIGLEKDDEAIAIIKDVFKKYGLESGEGPATTGKGDLGSGEEIDFDRDRVFAYRDKNWWQRGDALGELGGPDSETFYDTGKAHDPKFGKYCHLNCDCGRFLEIGNSVFMQFEKTVEGWKPLQNKNVDFGGGLERIAMVANSLGNIFESELFAPIIEEIEGLSGKKYADNRRAFEIVADHLKAAVFIMSEPARVGPSNKDQGYVVRRLIRRAAVYGRELGVGDGVWMKRIADIVRKIYKDVYPELKNNRAFVDEELEKEEGKFMKTLEKGLREFSKIDQTDGVSGKEAFNLYQTFGFPIEIIEELAAQKNVSVDKGEFEKKMKEHQELSRTASAGMFKGGLADQSEATTKLHTAAHLLLAGLRKVLGEHVVQKGSNITAERLRFDFSHSEKLTDEEIKQVEDYVNEAIKADKPVVCEEMDLESAKKSGAMGVFDDKYGNKVKVYDISPYSREICGGPHVARTGTLGQFKIQKEESAAAGIRRIRAVIL
ncbi:MAG: alanine--tRNA ligase [Patescibacteria group bacterium]|nr:alanine--tRNA ligase [Patescibacteria group bacterium]MCL5261959.1 alanine--tRNA ligase [Patescibacteria group bacterium]